MKNKKKEKPKINKKNLYLLFKYIAERHTIYKKRFIEKKKAPWTKDPILGQYRFTNVFRDLDTGTDFWINNIMPDCTNPRKMIFNAVIYRFINRIETIRYLGIQDPDFFSIKSFETILRSWKARGERVYTNAYMVSGYWSINPGADKITKTCTIIGWFHRDLHKITEMIMKGKLMKDRYEASKNTYTALKNIKGLGIFLAYQMAVDLGYWDSRIFDEDIFTIAGPGAKNGLNHIFKDKGDYTNEELIALLVKIQDKVYLDIDVYPDILFDDRVPPRLNLMAMENCLCEISKYLRAFYGKGRPRNKYHYRAEDTRGLGEFIE